MVALSLLLPSGYDRWKHVHHVLRNFTPKWQISLGGHSFAISTCLCQALTRGWQGTNPIGIDHLSWLRRIHCPHHTYLMKDCVVCGLSCNHFRYKSYWKRISLLTKVAMNWGTLLNLDFNHFKQGIRFFPYNKMLHLLQKMIIIYFLFYFPTHDTLKWLFSMNE